MIKKNSYEYLNGVALIYAYILKMKFTKSENINSTI